MAEPYVLTITSETDFDGTTPMNQSRGDFAQSGRMYSVTIEGPAGVIPADFFGLVSASAPKLVGVASDSHNPLNVALVKDSGSAVASRECITLSPQLQHLMMAGGDHLVVRTRNGGRVTLHLTVNALSERDHVELALRREHEPHLRHFRVRRSDGVGWSGAPGDDVLPATFTFDHETGILEFTTTLQGPLALETLYPRSNVASCYATVRFSGPAVGGSQIYVVDREQRRAVVVESALVEMAWSKVIYVTRDDLLLLNTPAPVDGAQIHTDIQLVEAPPRGRFVGRFDRSA